MKKYPVPTSIYLIFFASLLASCAVYTPMELSSIAPGSNIRVTMKDGEKIKDMKVSAADSAKIAGQITDDDLRQNRIINKGDIQSVERQKISIETTVGGIAIFAGVLFFIGMEFSVGLRF